MPLVALIQRCSSYISSTSNAHEQRLQDQTMLPDNSNNTGTVAGSAVSIGSLIVGYLTAAIPVLQVIALLVSITVGVMTAITWIKKHRKQ